jgi:hypothetical protein
MQRNGIEYVSNNTWAKHKSEGYMQWNIEGELVDVTASVQQNNFENIKQATYRYRCFTCAKLFSSEVGWREHQ